jgi:hypothetical protein
MTEAQRALEREHEAFREPWRVVCGAPVASGDRMANQNRSVKAEPGFFERFG